MASGYNDPPLGAISSIVEPPQDESRLESDSLNLSTASNLIDSPGAEHATSVLDPAKISSSIQQPHWTKYYVPGRLESYVPRRLDTSADHNVFFCDLCPATFARRDTLQLHKARTHDLMEIGYLRDMGAIDLPPYLLGITPNTGSTYSGTAFRNFEHGGLSSNPCQPCLSKGIDCIVNRRTSSKCCYCNHCDNGVYCGAAGVKLA